MLVAQNALETLDVLEQLWVLGRSKSDGRAPRSGGFPSVLRRAAFGGLVVASVDLVPHARGCLIHRRVEKSERGLAELHALGVEKRDDGSENRAGCKER